MLTKTEEKLICKYANEKVVW